MKYDDASWHYENQFPQGLPEIQAFVMPGMFFAWAIFNNLSSEEHLSQTRSLEKLKAHEITPAEYFDRENDGMLSDQDLNEEGNAFALAYYEGEDGGERFLADYLAVFGEIEQSPYHAPNTWESYDTYAPTLDKRYQEWKKG
ncbi:MAG: hypothetical protein RL538_92 [Candidatus Parcubacteria bacterium]|jgi:hypothetical protein